MSLSLKLILLVLFIVEPWFSCEGGNNSNGTEETGMDMDIDTNATLGPVFPSTPIDIITTTVDISEDTSSFVSMFDTAIPSPIPPSMTSTSAFTSIPAAATTPTLATTSTHDVSTTSTRDISTSTPIPTTSAAPPTTSYSTPKPTTSSSDDDESDFLDRYLVVIVIVVVVVLAVLCLCGHILCLFCYYHQQVKGLRVIVNSIVPVEDQKQGRSLFIDSGGVESKKGTSEEKVEFSTAAGPEQKNGKEVITMSTFSQKEAEGSNGGSGQESEKEGRAAESASEVPLQTQDEDKDDEAKKEGGTDTKAEDVDEKDEQSTIGASYLGEADEKPTSEATAPPKESPAALFEGFTTLETVMEELGKEL